MENKLKYSFDDEPISRFCYDNKRIEIHFKGHYDLIKDVYVEGGCIWTLKDWIYAKSKIGDEQQLHDLNRHIGVFSLILYMKYNDNNELEMLVSTIDRRYVTLFFKDPKLSLESLIM